MIQQNSTYPVAIVGGGPVGLFLAIALFKKEVGCIVLEKRTEQITHSRSLGIHPVSLERMEKIGLADHFLEAGIKIRRGIAHTGRVKIGSITFDSCPGPYPFVLSLPQYKTEALLENRLRQLDAGCLLRGAEVNGIDPGNDGVVVSYTRDGKQQNINCKLLVGCDGKNSFVRENAGIAFEGESYPDTYIMGDYSDNTVFGSDAAVFLTKEGLIESFPIESDRRRWVVKTDEFIGEVTRVELEKRVARRIGHDIGEEENFMLSSFGVQKYIAEPMAKGRVFLAGDAAHIVSPIGGQGMNLGWLDAWDLVTVLREALEGTSDISSLAAGYSRRRTGAASQAIKRAELNMALGRKRRIPILKNTLVWLMLNTPLKRLMAQMFTMRGLGRWPI